MKIHKLLIALALSAALAACGADQGSAPLRADMAPAEQVALRAQMAPAEPAGLRAEMLPAEAAPAPLTGEARPVESEGLVGVAAPVQP